MAQVKVLVFPCGSENASEIHQALVHSIHVELYGASSVDDHGRFRFERYRGGLPGIDAPDFDRVFAELLREWDIGLVFATHDTVQEYLATRTVLFGVTLVNGDPFAVKVARRKSRTYELFGDQVWSPDVYTDIGAVRHWPVVVKPDLCQVRRLQSTASLIVKGCCCGTGRARGSGSGPAFQCARGTKWLSRKSRK